MKKLLFFCVTLLCVTSLFAQKKLSSSSQKAIELFYQGLENYDRKEYVRAMTSLYKAVTEDPKFVEAYLVLAEVCESAEKNDEAITAYRRVVVLNPDLHPRALYNLGDLEFKQGLYEDAEKHLEAYLNYDLQSETSKYKAFEYLEKTRRAIVLKDNPVPFNPNNMGDSINSKFDEYLPALTADGKTLIITQRSWTTDEVSNITIQYEDFIISRYDDNTKQWSKAVKMPEPVNSADNEGAQSISPDGRYLYFAGCNRRDGLGSCDIYVSKRQGNQWGKPFNLYEPINSRHWESQPSIASDDKTLFFASSRPEGSRGGTDLWMSVLQDNGTWSEPINLGDSINTPGNESSPFIHFDNQTLYFSSDGHGGMGGKDLFYSKLHPDGYWTTPVNLGYPINTNQNEISLIVNSTGETAYIASDRTGGKGGQDIYSFELYEEARPLAVSYVKGKLFDAENQYPIEGKLEIINLRTGKIVAGATSDPKTGDFLVTLPTAESYAINVSKDGYLFYSGNFEMNNDKNALTPKTVDIPLQSVNVGATMVLNNIFYDPNQFKLKAESKTELDRLVLLLQKNSKLKIEISGHTDNTGSENLNIALSENRAKSIYDYLIENGIDYLRLTYVGYGFSKPVTSNDTEAGRAQNRRTEIKILEN